jgi:hypothetical protein
MPNYIYNRFSQSNCRKNQALNTFKIAVVIEFKLNILTNLPRIAIGIRNHKFRNVVANGQTIGVNQIMG